MVLLDAGMKFCRSSGAFSLQIVALPLGRGSLFFTESTKYLNSSNFV